MKPLVYQSDLAPKEIRGNKPFTKRTRRPGEALGPDDSLNWRKRPVYKTGDMDHNTYIPREGSCHKHLLSYGNLT